MMASNQTTGAVTGAASGAAQGAAVAGLWGAAIGGVIGGIGGLLSGGAADDAKKLAKDQAMFAEMETKENIKRMRQSAEQQVGMSRAVSYASNLQGDSGSAGKYANKLRSQWNADIAWTRFAGKKNAEFIREGGQAVSSGIMNNMFLQQAGTLLDAGAQFAGSGGFSRRPDSNPFGAPPKGGSGYNYMTGDF